MTSPDLPPDQSERPPEGQRTILQIYAVLAVSLLLSFVPLPSFALLALLTFTGVLIAAYVLRGRAESPDSLVAQHMTYIIRTIWITGLFGVGTLILGSVYMFSQYDPAPLLECVNVNTLPTDMIALQAMMQPCIDAFISANMHVFITATIISAGPLVVYLVYRMAKGINRANAGYRPTNLKSWF